MQRRQIGHTRGGVPINAFYLDSPSGVRVVLAEYGARVVCIEAPDRFGKTARIFGARGEVDGVEAIAANAGWGATHCAIAGLAGQGPAQSVWWGEALGDGVRFHYRSPAGEDGREAEVGCSVEYRLNSHGTLRVVHGAAIAAGHASGRAVAIDLITPLAFHLQDPNASSRPVHEVQIESREIVECDAAGTATGHLRRIEGTPVDRSTRARVSTSANALHHYVLGSHDGPARRVARLWDKASGRRVEIATTRPALQFESTKRPDDGAPAVALTPRNFPAADCHAHFPSPWLEGDTQATTFYRFGLDV